MESSQPPNQPITESPNLPVAATSQRDNTLVIGGVWMIVLAAFLLLCGLCSALFYAILPFTSQTRTSAVETNAVFGALTGIGILLGALFLWQGINTVRNRVPIQAARAFPHVLVFVVLFFVAILLGLGALAIPSLAQTALAIRVAAFIFPPWHFIAAAVPPLALLAYAAHRLGATSGLRALVVAFGWGALGATAIAVVVEVLIAVVFIVAAAVALSLAPGSQALIDQLRRQLALAQATHDYSAFSGWANDPKVLAGILLYAAVLVPFVEEGLKTLVVAFIDPRRTQLADALLWGMAAGAGFALFENLFNSNAALSVWAVVAFLRIGATIMHVANGATMGRGWYAARVERRWSQLFIAYLVSVFFHAAWNAVALTLSNSALSFLNVRDAPLATMLPATVLLLALIGALVLLAALGLAWIVRSARSAPAILTTAERSE